MPGRSTRKFLAAALVGALLLVTAGCGSDDVASTANGADIETSDESISGAAGSDGSSDGGSAPDVAKASAADCQALNEGYQRYVGNANQLTAQDTQEGIDKSIGEDGLVKFEEYIALLRPHQDIEIEAFGSLRAGLDNLESDIAAVREGRADERVFGYNVFAVASVVTMVCDL